jgi:hypothetical protein
VEGDKYSESKVYQYLIDKLMDLLCMLISKYGYPLAWDEKDLMIMLSRKLFNKDAHENYFIIVPKHQWECMMTEGWTNVSGKYQWRALK